MARALQTAPILAREAALARPAGVLLGRNVYSGNLFTLHPEDRTTHVHVIGASKRGKSNFLAMLALQDILQTDGVQRGITVIDPHASIVEPLLAVIAEHRLYRHRRIRVLDPTDALASFSLNPFVSLSNFEVSTLCEILVKATLTAFGQDAVNQSPMIAEVLYELYTALGRLRLPLADVNDFLYRDRVTIRRHHVERLAALDPEAASFWADLETLPTSRRDEYLATVRRRLRTFLRTPNLHRVFSQKTRAIDIAAEMDAGSIVLVNLKQGPNLSGDSARLLGTLLVNEYYTACFRRTNKLQHFLYIDECQRFLSADVAHILDESRKFGLSMILAHQHLGHLREAGEHVFRSVMTNTLVKVVFGGLDPDDSEYMARITFRGQFDLQRPKPRLYRMAAVGNEKVRLENESTGTNASTTSTRSRSFGTTTGENASTTKNTSRTKSKAKSHVEQSGTAETDSWSRSHMDSWSRSHSESAGTAEIDTDTTMASSSQSVTAEPPSFLIAGDELVVTSGSGSGQSHTAGQVVSSGSSDTETEGGSDTETEGGSTTRSRSKADGVTRGVAVTRGTATTTGTSRSVSSETGASEATAAGRSTSRGSAEAYVTQYELMPGPLYELPEQIHMKSVALAHCPVGQAWVRIGGKRPRRIDLPLLELAYVLPARIERARQRILAATPFCASAAQVDAEYTAHRAALIEAANPQPVDEPKNWREGGD